MVVVVPLASTNATADNASAAATDASLSADRMHLRLALERRRRPTDADAMLVSRAVELTLQLSYRCRTACRRATRPMR
eukprot:gene17128-12255_t